MIDMRESTTYQSILKTGEQRLLVRQGTKDRKAGRRFPGRNRGDWRARPARSLGRANARPGGARLEQLARRQGAEPGLPRGQQAASQCGMRREPHFSPHNLRKWRPFSTSSTREDISDRQFVVSDAILVLRCISLESRLISWIRSKA